MIKKILHISVSIGLGLLVTICLGLLVFPGSLLIIKQFGEIRKITAESMMPTLHINDRLIVQRIHGLSEIRRGELVVYYPPFSILESDPMSMLLRETGLSGMINDKETGKDVAYVHRVLGLPGDKIEIRPGEGLFINGKLLNEPYISEVATSCTFIKPKNRLRFPTASFSSWVIIEI